MWISVKYQSSNQLLASKPIIVLIHTDIIVSIQTDYWSRSKPIMVSIQTDYSLDPNRYYRLDPN